MATVKLSQKLKEHIISKVRNMRNVELNKHPVEDRFYIAHDDPRVLRIAFGEYADVVKSLPDKWFEPKDAVRVRVNSMPAENGDTFDLTATFHPNASPAGTQHFLFPRGADYHPGVRLHGDVGEWVEMRNIAEQARVRRDVVHKWNDIERSVIAFFESFPSINAAIKHEPNMMMYLPAEAIDRMEQKSERSKPVTPIIEVDVGGLIGAAVSHRLGV